MKNIDIKISTTKLSIDDAFNFVKNPRNGAVNIFLGTIRNINEKKKVKSITYDVHTKIVETTFFNICNEALKKWHNTYYYIAHIQGKIYIGDIGLIIAVSAQHRKESFLACEYVINQLKKRAPIWKKEHYIDTTSKWLGGSSLKV